MNAARLRNFGFAMMFLTVLAVWRATRDRPMQTSKLVAALVLAVSSYGLMNRAKKLEEKSGQ